MNVDKNAYVTENLRQTDRQTDITVIIPVYNCEKYLEAAVNSVLSQQYHHIGIVIVDDGSTDGSSELCDSLAATYAPRIHVIHQKNAGVSAARNVGIEYALTQNQNGYLAFLDADDAWAEGFFALDIVALLSKGYLLIGFQSCYCDKNLRSYSKPSSMKEGTHDGGQDNVWLHSGQHFAAMLYACALVKKENIRFFEGLSYSEDKIFSMQCMYLANRIRLENRLLYYYRKNSSSAMSCRVHGIPYFTPMLGGYLKLDQMMRRYTGRNPLVEARKIAGIFTMEMIAEHYQFFRSKREVDQFFTDHPCYVSLLTAEGEYSDLAPNVEYEFYINHPAMYIINNYFVGGVKLCKKVLRKVWYLIR